jgi:ferredoxin
MTVPLTLLVEPGRAEARRELSLSPGTSILKAAHAAGIDVTATCGGRGRCTSCRVKFVAGTVPPPSIGDEVQLGDALVREGYRLACQCVPIEAVTVELAPPLGRALVPDPRRRARRGRRRGHRLRCRQAAGEGPLPREEHHQTSDAEQLAAAIGMTAATVPAGRAHRAAPGPARGSRWRDGHDLRRRILSVERGDTTSMRFGLAIDIGPPAW